MKGWALAKVGTLVEDLAGWAPTQICLAQGPERILFKIVGAPHMTPYMVSIGS